MEKPTIGREWYRYHTEGVAEFILSLYPRDFKGIAVDVGAYAAKWLSNTYLLELLGWKVYCIEPNPHCADLLLEREHVHQMAIGKENRDDVDFFIYRGPGVPPLCEAGSRLENLGGEPEVVKVRLRTLDWFMETEAIHSGSAHLDFLSIDTEGTEMDVLLGIDLARWGVQVICIENRMEFYKDQEIYLESRGYKKINRLVENDIYIRKDCING